MLKVLIGEASKGYLKNRDITIKIMYKNIELKRFHNDLWLQVYMHVFVYVYTQTIPVGDHFTASKTFFVNYEKMSTQGSVPKIVLDLVI